MKPVLKNVFQNRIECASKFRDAGVDGNKFVVSEVVYLKFSFDSPECGTM